MPAKIEGDFESAILPIDKEPVCRDLEPVKLGSKFGSGGAKVRIALTLESFGGYGTEMMKKTLVFNRF